MYPNRTRAPVRWLVALLSIIAMACAAGAAATVRYSAVSPESALVAGRLLTQNELAALAIAYPGADFGKVRVYSRRWRLFQGEDYLIAPNGNIYWPKADAVCPDFTACGRTMLRTFVHEAAHIVQYQSGINVVLSAAMHQIVHHLSLHAYDPYKFDADLSSPLGLNVEAAAEWHAARFCNMTAACD